MPKDFYSLSVARERLTFPAATTFEGVPVTLYADGSAAGDADALEAQLRASKGVPTEGTLQCWFMLALLRSSQRRTSPAIAVPSKPAPPKPPVKPAPPPRPAARRR